jgi:hypothetical protein
MIEQALERWLAAMNAPTPMSVEAALSPDARIHRYGIFERRDEVVDCFTDPEQHLAWLARSPEGTVFSLLSVEPTQEGFEARYRIEVEDFVNEGSWTLRLSEDGRIAELHHRADAIEVPPLPGA